ncbi:alpha/beta fold hydrolase [Macrococcus animalis]|uniref:alpha/beta fold hydrolase n=1 Tax=Macrococcus animalis TaxID=3395467 RepID=UPI0039BDED85
MEDINSLLKENHLIYKSVSTEKGSVSYFKTDNNREYKTTLLLMHRFGATGLDYLPIIKLLQDQFHIISIDLPERGESKLIGTNDFSPTSIATWLNAFVTTIQLEKFHLIGHSMAAHYGLAYAKEFSVESLILLDGGYLVPGDFEGYSLEKELNDTRKFIQTLKYDSEEALIASLTEQGNSEVMNIIDRRLFKINDNALVFTLSEDVAVQMTKDVANYPDYELIKNINNEVYIIRCDLPKEVNPIRELGINEFLKVKEAKVTVLENSNHSVYHSKTKEVSELIKHWIQENSH